ncbi:MAG TPA: DNA polymerase/3'-5' exonuclease PolX [Candidatus Binatia bacterium]|nr:DNA polymerase/3'-5' exonuclease PolX [Candidatus Binatia bacterium]
MKNPQVAQIFREISAFLEMEGVPFKPRAYEKAAESIAALEDPIERVFACGGVKALEEIPGIGKSFAAKIAEFLATGKIVDHEKLRDATPVDLEHLLGIEGLGPKGIKSLYEHLGVRTLADLEAAARAGKIREAPGFGEKSEQKILQGIGFLEARTGRLPIGAVLPLAREIEARLREIAGVEQVAIAGSLRRRKETIGDMDFLVVASEPALVMKRFASMPEVAVVHGRGSTKGSVRLSIGMDADLRLVPADSFGAALQYFTGSKDHGVACRKIAIEKGLKLNEYGVFRGSRSVAGRSEEEVYAALGLPWIPPELREDRGEIAAALAGKLPHVLDYGSLRGDLQTQTSWTDGADSIEAMARAAKKLGLEYIAITDHTRSLAMTRGSDEEKLRRQMADIDAINAKLRGFRILKGAEVNIQRDGTLDIDDATLAALDVVGVAVHSHFHLPRKEMTERVCRAMRSPHADILFHPTGRVLGRREPYEIDFEEVVRVAVETGTALEIDAFPDRLDLNDDHARRAVEAGVKLTIDSDAHSATHFSFLDYGIAVARRAWVEAKNVLNTQPVERLLASLKGGLGSRERRASSGRRSRR